jgi:hypothetical protein
MNASSINEFNNNKNISCIIVDYHREMIISYSRYFDKEKM